MNLLDLFRILFMLRTHYPKINEHKLSGEEIMDIIHKIAPNKLDDNVVCDWTKSEIDTDEVPEDALCYKINRISGNGARPYYVALYIYAGTYDEDIDKDSGVYGDKSTFFTLKTHKGEIEHYRGQLMNVTRNLVGIRSFSQFNDIDFCLKYIHDFDESIKNELAPVIFAVKLKKSSKENNSFTSYI